METINTQLFIDYITEVSNGIRDRELSNIEKAAEICADTIMNDGVVQVFGSGHSLAFAKELIGRPGFLVPFHQILSDDFVTSGMYELEDYKDPDNRFERRPGIAQQFFELYDIRENDCFIITSNSGINGLVIDLAHAAKEKGHKVIVITSLDHTLNEDSRHPSGKKLMDFGDVVIDNCGPKGDAMIPLEDGGKIGSASAISGLYIGHALVIAITAILDDRGYDTPLLLDEKNDESKQRNKELLDKYKGRI